jgi:hypothetical protein
MSLPVCPSAFIRFAVVMCSESSTFRGRPNGPNGWPIDLGDASGMASSASTSRRGASLARENEHPLLVRSIAQLLEGGVPC